MPIRIASLPPPIADYAQSNYSAANIALGNTVDGAFVDVDATNAKITITPSSAGIYRVVFSFTVYQGILALSQIGDLFRLTDGATNSKALEIYIGTAVDFTVTVSLSAIFSWTATSQTVKLQKKISAAAGTINQNQILCDNTNERALHMEVYRL